jgi:hypothetical protein
VEPAGASRGGAVITACCGCFVKRTRAVKCVVSCGSVWFGSEVRGELRLRLVRQWPRADEPAIRGQIFALGMKYRLNRQRARLVPVEFERRQKVHRFDGFHMPAGKHPEGGFGKGFDAHHAGQDGRAVDLMIIEERLNPGIERRLDGEAVVKSHTGDLADHRSLRHDVRKKCLFRVT